MSEPARPVTPCTVCGVQYHAPDQGQRCVACGADSLGPAPIGFVRRGDLELALKAGSGAVTVAAIPTPAENCEGWTQPIYTEAPRGGSPDLSERGARLAYAYCPETCSAADRLAAAFAATLPEEHREPLRAFVYELKRATSYRLRSGLQRACIDMEALRIVPTPNTTEGEDHA